MCFNCKIRFCWLWINILAEPNEQQQEKSRKPEKISTPEKSNKPEKGKDKPSSRQKLPDPHRQTFSRPWTIMDPIMKSKETHVTTCDKWRFVFALPAFTSASPKVRVLMQRRGRTGDNLKVEIEGENGQQKSKWKLKITIKRKSENENGHQMSKWKVKVILLLEHLQLRDSLEEVL